MKLLTALAAALALAACTAEAPTDTPDQPPPPAAADANALTAQGWGPLRIGMTRAEVVAAAGEDANPNAVGGPDPAQCDNFHPSQTPAGVLVMIENNLLTRITATGDSALRSNRGFGIGDSAAAIKAAYGAEAFVSPHAYQGAPAEYITVWDGAPAGAETYVQDESARGVRYEIGGDGMVNAIHIGGPSIQYVEGCS
jgi:hypothetical protein